MALLILHVTIASAVSYHHTQVIPPLVIATCSFKPHGILYCYYIILKYY